MLVSTAPQDTTRQLVMCYVMLRPVLHDILLVSTPPPHSTTPDAGADACVHVGEHVNVHTLVFSRTAQHH
jgi:hypothetical protein